MGHGIVSDLAGMVAQKEVGLDMALQIHLGSNHFPPLTFMADTCKAAILAFEDDDPFRLIELPQGVNHQKYGNLVPATELVAELHLGPFVPQEPDW
jgi:hypothetical protein